MAFEKATAVLDGSKRSEQGALASLAALRDSHPFWSNRLFTACRTGSLTREDFQFIFSQYYLYSRNFTRYLNGLMINCEDDLLRSKLSENLWEEGGGTEPERRHSEIFRRFLRQGLGVDIAAIDFLDCTRYFVREYLDFCRGAPPAEISAFLSLGTESIVARMYGIFLEGLRQAGVAEPHLEFFHIHIACDDEHAQTLEEIMCSYSGQPGWYEACQRGLSHALELRQHFFESLYQEVQRRRVQGLLDRIQSRESLTPPGCKAEQLRFRESEGGELLYSNAHERLNIQFSVTRAPFPTEVLDPRFVRIPPGRNNENHKHAHETIFVVLKGSGEVHVDERVVPVEAGDLIFVPRWSMHQSRNTGSEELVLLAVADYGLTGKAYVGDYLKTARMKHGAPQEVPAEGAAA